MGILFTITGLCVLAMLCKGSRIPLFDSPYLALIALSAVSFGTQFLLMMYFQAMGNPELSLLFQKTATLSFLFVFMWGYFYHERFISVTPPLSRLGLMLSLFAFILALHILSIAGIFQDLHLVTLVYGLTYTYGIIYHVFAIRVYFRILKIWNETAVKINIACMFLIGTCATVSTLTYWLETLNIVMMNSPEELILLSISSLALITGLTSLIIMNLKWSDFIYYIPFPIHAIMIYNSGGVLIYFRNVYSKSGETTLRRDESLISGALSGLSSFFQEVLGLGTKLTHVSASNYDFFFLHFPGESGTLAVLTSGANALLKQSIERFRKGIKPEWLAEMEKPLQTQKFEKEIDTLLSKTFPYLVIREENERETV